jgi:hypothetical protein
MCAGADCESALSFFCAWIFRNSLKILWIQAFVSMHDRRPRLTLCDVRELVGILDGIALSVGSDFGADGRSRRLAGSHFWLGGINMVFERHGRPERIDIMSGRRKRRA